MNFISLIALLILTIDQSVTQISETRDFFEEGLAYLEEGEAEQALYLWDEARKFLDSREISDFRIGFTFIEYVTEYNLDHLYPVASDLYMWSTGSNQLYDNFKYISKEVEMLKPIISEDTYNTWRRYSEENNYSLFTEIRSFWTERNPVRSTPANERLIEHWERIAHARKHFNKNSSSVYGTDDRGIIYVRFGEPDMVYSGTIQLNTQEIRNKIYDLETFNHINSPEAAFSIRQGVVQSYTPQAYEYWRYYNLHPEPLFFLFGENANENYFGLLDRIESLIPDTAFRTSVVGGRGTGGSIRASSFLQFMLYNHLSNHDQFFGQMLNIFEDNWYRAVNSARLNGQIIQSQNSPSVSRDKMLEAYNRAPTESGSIDRSALKVSLSHKSYMFRDENLNPEFEIVLYSDELKTLKTDLPRTSLLMHFGIVSMDHENQVTYENTQDRFLTIDSTDEHSGLLQPLSISMGSDNKKSYLGYLEIKYQDEYHPLITDKEGLLVTGETEIGIKPDIDDAGMLSRSMIMSDLILGGINQPQTIIRGIPSGLSADNTFHEDENLQLYFEIYRTQTAGINTGSTPIEINYIVLPLDTGPDKKVDIRESSVISGPVSQHYIEFEPWNLAPDKYKIEVNLYTSDQEHINTISQTFTIY